MWDTPCTDGRSGLKTKQEPIEPLRTNCTINKCSGTRFWVSQTNQCGTCAFNKSRPTRRVPRDSSPSGSKKGRMIRNNPRWYLCSPQPGIVGVIPHQYFCCLIQITLNLGDLVGLGRVLRGRSSTSGRFDPKHSWFSRVDHTVRTEGHRRKGTLDNTLGIPRQSSGNVQQANTPLNGPMDKPGQSTTKM